MDSSSLNRIYQTLKELKKDYIGDLPKKIQLLRDHFKKGELEELCNIFHKAKGSGSTYGCPEVSQLCTVMESLCENNQYLLSKSVPVALDILTDIHRHRESSILKDEAYDLQKDQRFLELTKLQNS